MRYAVSFDFWNTLFANGEEKKRQKLRLTYFRKVLLSHKRIKKETIEAAFDVSLQYFIEIWHDEQRTPTAVERIKYMAKILAVDLNQCEIDQVAEYFGNLIFTIPPETIDSVHKVTSELANIYPLAIISDTGYISGKFIRRFLEQEKLLTNFSSPFFF